MTGPATSFVLDRVTVQYGQTAALSDVILLGSAMVIVGDLLSAVAREAVRRSR